MTNTQLRIFSALILLLVVLICMALGKMYGLILIGFAGFLIVDEILTNFAEIRRDHISYIFSTLSYVLGFIYFNFVDFVPAYFNHFINGGIAFNLVLVANMFVINPLLQSSIEKLFKSYSFVVGLLVLVLILNICNILHRDSWRLLIFGVILLNSSVDVFAWFFGKKFGKIKLFPRVSPKKTVEGALGGVLASYLLTIIYWWIAFSFPNPGLLVGFFILCSISQLGDLIQSQLKRQFHIKDSSGIIPGHGGVYDRLDSLLFVAPFYVLLLDAYFVLA